MEVSVIKNGRMVVYILNAHSDRHLCCPGRHSLIHRLYFPDKLFHAFVKWKRAYCGSQNTCPWVNLEVALWPSVTERVLYETVLAYVSVVHLLSFKHHCVFRP